MDNDTQTGDGPTNTTPTGNPDLGMPGDTPLTDAPVDPTADGRPLTDDGPQTADDGRPPTAGEFVTEPAEDDLTAEPVAEPLVATPLEVPRAPRRLSRGEREMVDRVQQRFAACGRCGYLYADFQLLLGEETLQTAAIQAHDGWLRLEGNEHLRPLLVNAYGIRLDLGFDAMDGLCPECRRRFVFAALDDGVVRLKLRT